MLNKIKKLLILIFLILLGIYLLFPFLARAVISSKLPPEYYIQSFEVDYPGFNNISVQHLQINSDGLIISIEGMILGYHLSSILSDNTFIEKVTINKVDVNQIFNQETSSVLTIKLPEIKARDISKLKKIKNLSIQQLGISLRNKTVNLTAIDGKNLDTEEFLVTFTIDSLFDELLKPVQFISTIQHNENEIIFFIEQAQNKLFNFAYITDDKEIKVTAEINIENVEALLSKNFINTIFESKGIISFDLIQNRITNNSVISLHIEGQGQKEIEYPFTNGSVKTSAIKFNLESEIKLLYKNQELQFSNTQFELIASKLNVVDNKKLYTLNADDYKITGSIDNIQSTLKNINDSSWKLSGLFSSPKIQINNEQEAIDIDAHAELRFDLINDQNILIDGTLRLSEMIFSHPNILINSQLTAEWKGIVPSLTQGIISLQLESDNGHVYELSYDHLTLKSDINLLNEQWIGDGKLLINEQVLAPYSFVYSNNTNEFSMELNKTQFASQLVDYYLEVIGTENSISLNVLEGEISHSGAISISDKFKADSEFEIKDMLFKFGDNTVKGLNLQQKLISTNPLSLHALLDIESLTFSSGLKIINISGIIDTKADNVIEIKDVEGEIWEGKLKAAKIQLLDNNFIRTSIALNDLSLTELIFFMDIPGLYAEGKIQFNLPLTMKDGAVSVNEGAFKTTEDGIIKYSSGQTQSKEDENIALKALDNFHYKSLDGTISYNQLGEYHIKLHLLGSNPDLYDGYPIDFILNLNGELSGVFRSLFLTGNFEEAVMEQVRSTQSEQ